MSSYIESAAYDIDKLSFLFLGSLKGKTVIITSTANDDPLIKFSYDEDMEIDEILRGYKIVKEQQVERQGVFLENYVMIKKR